MTVPKARHSLALHLSTRSARGDNSINLGCLASDSDRRCRTLLGCGCGDIAGTHTSAAKGHALEVGNSMHERTSRTWLSLHRTLGAAAICRVKAVQQCYYLAYGGVKRDSGSHLIVFFRSRNLSLHVSFLQPLPSQPKILDIAHKMATNHPLDEKLDKSADYIDDVEDQKENHVQSTGDSVS